MHEASAVVGDFSGTTLITHSELPYVCSSSPGLVPTKQLYNTCAHICMIVAIDMIVT